MECNIPPSSSTPITSTGENAGNMMLSAQGTNVHARGRGNRLNNYVDLLPQEAKPCSEEDREFRWCDEFLPLRDPGPHLPFADDHTPSELELVRLFISDDVVQYLVEATNLYAEGKKELKKAMYLSFKPTVLDEDEMMRYIAVLLLLSINNVRNYKQAWNARSAQVSFNTNQKKSSVYCRNHYIFFHIGSYPSE